MTSREELINEIALKIIRASAEKDDKAWDADRLSTINEILRAVIVCNVHVTYQARKNNGDKNE